MKGQGRFNSKASVCVLNWFLNKETMEGWGKFKYIFNIAVIEK